MSAQSRAAPTTGIDLAVDDMRLRVRPDIGCSISNLTKSAQPLLRPATLLDESSGDPLRLACFPMIPYCNRIAGGRFRWRGRDVALARNMEGEPNSIHGCAWRKPLARGVALDEHARMRISARPSRATAGLALGVCRNPRVSAWQQPSRGGDERG